MAAEYITYISSFLRQSIIIRLCVGIIYAAQSYILPPSWGHSVSCVVSLSSELEEDMMISTSSLWSVAQVHLTSDTWWMNNCGTEIQGVNPKIQPHIVHSLLAFVEKLFWNFQFIFKIGLNAMVSLGPTLKLKIDNVSQIWWAGAVKKHN